MQTIKAQSVTEAPCATHSTHFMQSSASVHVVHSCSTLIYSLNGWCYKLQEPAWPPHRIVREEKHPPNVASGRQSLGIRVMPSVTFVKRGARQNLPQPQTSCGA